jgi:hypothetical protein
VLASISNGFQGGLANIESMDFVKNRCYSCCEVLQACPVYTDSPVAECCQSAAVGSACRRAGYWQLWGVAGTVSRIMGLLRVCRLQQKRSWLKRSTWPRDSMCTLRRWLASRCTVVHGLQRVRVSVAVWHHRHDSRARCIHRSHSSMYDVPLYFCR